jgi:membrane fusion protein, multidrug efflux system
MKPIVSNTVAFCLAATALGVLLSACGKKEANPTARPPAEVSVVTVTAERIQHTTELPGRISPVREAQVRARATGILLKRLFTEGANVQAGQVLFEIDPAPLQANLASAKAALAKAEASLRVSKANMTRYGELAKTDVISKQDYDQAVATLGQDEAELLAGKAAVQTAELNLSYASVTAPISGRIGISLETEGALVSATDATQLAVIRQMDPVYFDFTQSSTEVLRLRRELETGAIQSASPGAAQVTLMLEDGSVYPHAGRLLFSDIAVEPTTGMITLRAELPNPENLLLPGMFARAQIVEGVNTNALTIPQRTVVRGAAGASTVLVVNDENKVELRNIEIERTEGHKVIVAHGLKAGERVIVEGSQKAPPGSMVKPVPFTDSSMAGSQAHLR